MGGLGISEGFFWGIVEPFSWDAWDIPAILGIL